MIEQVFRQDARWSLFLAIHRLAPEVFDDLAGEPYAALTAIEGDEWDETRSAFRKLRSAPSAQMRRPQRWSARQERVYSALTTWMKRHHLTQKWCFDLALETLYEWCYRPERLQGRKIPARIELEPWNDRIELLDDPFEDAWWPTEESRAEAKKKLMVKASSAIEAYLDRVEARLGGSQNKGNPEHFEWLAKYQLFPDQSFHSLADALGKDRHTVIVAVKATARLVGLQLKPGAKPGRPKK